MKATIEAGARARGITAQAAGAAARGRHPHNAGGLVEAGLALGLMPAAARTFARGRYGIREAAVTKHEDPAGAFKGGDFGKADYGFSPTDDPESWDLLLTLTPGGDPDPASVRAAVAAIDPANAAVPTVTIPQDQMATVVAKLSKAWKAAGLGELPALLADEGLMASFRQLGHTSVAGLRAAARGRSRRI